jgi:hypothetical protein
MNTYQAWTDRYLPAALLVLAAVLVFTNLDGGGLRNGDEARYAIVADEILRTGDAVTLHYEGQPYFQKAPLRFWISALTYAVFGVNEITVRFWSALAGLGCIAAVWWLGRRLWGAWAGLSAALILATTPAFLHVHGARTGEMDTLMTLCWLLALVPLAGERVTRLGFLTACFFAALCGMTKHLAFAPLAFLTLGPGLLVTGRWRDITRLWVLEGAAVALMVVGPWHLLQWYQHGNLFWEVYLGRVVVETAFAFAGPQPGPEWYFPVMFAGGWPWPFLWAAGLAWTIVNARRHPAGLLPALMVAVVLGFTLVAQRKLAWYVIPAYPALALMAGGALSRGLSAWSWRTTAWTVLLSWSAFAAFRMGAMTWLFADRPAYQVPLDAEFFFQLLPRPGGLWGLGLLFGLSVLAGAVAPRCVVRPDRPLPRGAMGGVILVLILGVFAARNAAAPLATRAVPPMKETVMRLNETLDPEGTVVIGLHRDRPRDDVTLFYLYHLEGKIRRASPAQARAYLAEERFAGVVILPDEEAAPPGAGNIRILGRSAGCIVVEKSR